MIENIRTTLIITLSILVVVLAARRFRQYVKRHHTPVPQQMELLAIEVAYHPMILRVQVSVPMEEELVLAMLSDTHAPHAAWPTVRLTKGEHVLELPLHEDADGTYFFELASRTQRTERRFIVRKA